jgi:hypothetical protein
MQSNFWNYLFETIEIIEAMDENNIVDQVATRLETITFLYERKFDPANSFEEYVALKFIETISQVIKKT